MKETLNAARWEALAAKLNAFVRRPSVYATHEFRERLERRARNNLAWGLEQLAFGRETFRWTARF